MMENQGHTDLDYCWKKNKIQYFIYYCTVSKWITDIYPMFNDPLHIDLYVTARCLWF